MSDIDIDFANREDIFKHIVTIPASLENGKIHPSGRYVTDIPIDPITGFACIDYKKAESLGYYKIDFLNMSVYSFIKDVGQYNQLMEMETPWEKILDKSFCEKVVHIGNYHNVVSHYEPSTIEEMAMVLSVIRPGKKHLIGKSFDILRDNVWKKEIGQEHDGVYAFKKSHSIAYAVLVSLHIKLLSYFPDQCDTFLLLS